MYLKCVIYANKIVHSVCQDIWLIIQVKLIKKIYKY